MRSAPDSVASFAAGAGNVDGASPRAIPVGRIAAILLRPDEACSLLGPRPLRPLPTRRSLYDSFRIAKRRASDTAQGRRRSLSGVAREARRPPAGFLSRWIEAEGAAPSRPMPYARRTDFGARRRSTAPACPISWAG